MEVFYIVLALLCLFAGGAIGFIARLFLNRRDAQEARGLASRVLEEARKEADNIKKEAIIQGKEQLIRAKNDFEKEYKEKRKELENVERRINNREEAVEKRMELISRKEVSIETKEQAISDRESLIKEKQAEAERIVEEQRLVLQKIAGVTSQEAKDLLIQSMEQEAKKDAAGLVRRIEEEATNNAENTAREIIALAVQRYSSEYVAENTVTAVSLPNEEMKGKIIGREGRNIRAIEAATGVDLIVDDTPEAVVVSSFDPIRREIACISLAKLIADGRIHPGRIEGIVKKAEQDVNQTIRTTGSRTSFDLGIHDLDPEIVFLIGSLKYRTSYSQNVLQHSIEVAHLAGMMAAELKLSITEAKRAGLLHDIGKALDYKMEGTHAELGAEFARKRGEKSHIVEAIASHHNDGRLNSVLAVLVQAADSLSAARPGARREMMAAYVKRLKDLEAIANSFAGVDKSFAIQAGREIRILVESEKMSDDECIVLCKDVAKKIETNLTYPGQIKVTVVRETRVSEIAK